MGVPLGPEIIIIIIITRPFSSGLMLIVFMFHGGREVEVYCQFLML